MTGIKQVLSRAKKINPAKDTKTERATGFKSIIGKVTKGYKPAADDKE